MGISSIFAALFGAPPRKPRFDLSVLPREFTTKDALLFLELPATASNQKSIHRALRDAGFSCRVRRLGGIGSRVWTRPLRCDIAGRPYATVDQVVAGTLLEADGDFDCIEKGAVLTVTEFGFGLCVPCTHGRHQLDGQRDDGEAYVGLYLAGGPHS
jgi:hypothetical protein